MNHYCRQCENNFHLPTHPDGRRCALCQKPLENSTDEVCEACSKKENICISCGESIEKNKKPKNKGFFNGAGFILE